MRANQKMRPVAILAGSRTPFTKSSGLYSRTSNKDLMIATLRDLVAKTNLQGEVLGDVALGAVMKNASDWNMAR